MAEEVTSLRLSIDSTSAVKAEKDLNKLSNSSDKLEKNVKKNTDSMASSFGSLKTAIAGVGLSTLAVEAVKTADSMKLLEARINLTSTATDNYKTIQKDMTKIANENGVAIGNIGNLYTKLAMSLKPLGVQTSTVMNIVDGFSKSLLISGASTEEASSSTLQFAQAMASGRLQGDEFRSMAENSPRFMKAMQDGLGKTSAEIRQMAEDGKLTTEVVGGALIDSMAKLRDEASKMPMTVGKAFNELKNELTLTVEQFDKVTGTNDKLAQAFKIVTESIISFREQLPQLAKDMDEWEKRNEKGLYTVKVVGESILGGLMKAGGALYDFEKEWFSQSIEGALQTAGAIGEITGIASDSVIKKKKEDKKLLDSLSKTIDDLNKKEKESVNLEKDKKSKEELKNIVLPATEVKKQVEKALEEYALYYKAIGDNETYLSIKRYQEAEKYKNLNKEQINSIIQAESDKINKVDKLSEDWNKRKLELAYENEIAQSDEMAKPFIQLEKKYKEDLEHFKGNKEAQLKLSENYYIEAQRLQDDAVAKYDELEQAKAKKDQEFVNNALGLHEDATTKIIQKYTEIFAKSELFTAEQIEKLIENMNEALEKAKPELKFNASIELDPSSLDGTAKAVANIGKSMDKLGVEQKQYQENLKKAKGDSQALAKVEEDHTKSQINGYANMAGAMSNMFEQGSKEAAAFQAVESGLAVVAAVRAIMTQGTGDPYTAIPRMVAMAAMVASTLQNVGIAFGANITKTSTTYGDIVSAMTANTGTGSVLGDSKAQSESIKKSMDILEDFAQPQYSVLTQMNKYLASIDEKLGGVSSLIYQNAGYAMGKGYTNTSSEKQNITFKGVDPIPFMNNIIAKIPIVNIVADLFGGVVNSILGGLFGKKSISKSITDSGLYFADTFLKSAVEGIYGQAYQTISTTVTKKSWFSKSSSTTVNTYFQELDEETNRQFSLVLDNLYQTTLLAGKALDTSSSDVANSLSNFIVSIGKISLLGKTGDQIKEELEAVFGRVGDSISQTAFPLLTQFQAVGEGLFETMTRVATGMEEAGYYINLLGKSFTDVKYTDIINKQGDVGFEALLQSIVKADEATYGLSNSVVEMLGNLDATAEELYTAYRAFGSLRLQLSATGKDITYLTSTMIAGAGGMSELSGGLSDYIENFMSSSEQIAYNTSVLKAEFDAAGVAMPKTSAEFKVLVQSIDITTKSGQDLYGRIIALSGGFADLQEEIKGNGLSDLLTSITAFVTSLRADTTTSIKTTFDTFMTSFNSMIDAINNGSTDLTTIGTTAISNAQSYINAVTSNATSSRDIAFAKSVIANKFEGVVASTDVTIGTVNETLKISLGEKSAIVMELQALRSQIDYLNSLNTTQTATSVKTLNAVRATIPA